MDWDELRVFISAVLFCSCYTAVEDTIYFLSFLLQEIVLVFGRYVVELLCLRKKYF